MIPPTRPALNRIDMKSDEYQYNAAQLRDRADDLKSICVRKQSLWKNALQLWNDSSIEPCDTRTVLGNAHAVASHGPAPGDERHGIFRM